MYFDKDWKITKNVSEAHFYRTIDKEGDKYILKDFFISDILQMKAVCSSVTPKLIFDGQAKWYFANGQLKRETFYQNNSKRGIERLYYEDGTPHVIIDYRDKSFLILQYWTSDGKPGLRNGTGTIIEENKDIPFASHRELKDSLVIVSYTVSDDRRDTIYVVTEKSANFFGEKDEFYQSLAKAITYPKAARKERIQGTVYIGFVVNKDGKVRDVWIAKGIGGGCDEAALEAFSKQTDWQPAEHNGKPVNYRMVLPVVFRL